jgi:hypothetical protein
VSTDIIEPDVPEQSSTARDPRRAAIINCEARLQAQGKKAGDSADWI